MNYNAKSKIDKINELESNQKAKAMVESASLQEKDTLIESKQASKQESGGKKVFSFSLNPKILAEVEEFLKEFGRVKESKSSFIEDSLVFYLEYRKQQLQEELEQKLKNLRKIQRG